MTIDQSTSVIDNKQYERQIIIILSKLGKIYDQQGSKIIYKLIASTLFLSHLIRSGRIKEPVVQYYIARIGFYTAIFENGENIQRFPNTVEVVEINLQKKSTINTIFNELYSLHIVSGQQPDILKELKDLQTKTQKNNYTCNQSGLPYNYNSVDYLYNLFLHVSDIAKEPFLPKEIFPYMEVFIDAIEFYISVNKGPYFSIEDAKNAFDAYELARKIHYESFSIFLQKIFNITKDRIINAISKLEARQREQVKKLNPNSGKTKVTYVMIITELIEKLAPLKERLAFFEKVIKVNNSKIYDANFCYLLLAIMIRLELIINNIEANISLEVKDITLLINDINTYLGQNEIYIKVA